MSPCVTVENNALLRPICAVDVISVQLKVCVQLWKGDLSEIM
jgi:hypothetical protein